MLLFLVAYSVAANLEAYRVVCVRLSFQSHRAMLNAKALPIWGDWNATTLRSLSRSFTRCDSLGKSCGRPSREDIDYGGNEKKLVYRFSLTWTGMEPINPSRIAMSNWLRYKSTWRGEAGRTSISTDESLTRQATTLLARHEFLWHKCHRVIFATSVVSL